MKIFSINTNSYEPVSFGKSYLYNQYDKIYSFITSNFGNKYKNILAKPIISENQVLWHSDSKNTMNRISDLSEDVQNSIKQQYWLFLEFINQEISKLLLSKDFEKQSWGNLLKEVFNDDNNIILSDGNDWCLLWGWKFRNNQENYLLPKFKSKADENIPYNNTNLSNQDSSFLNKTQNTVLDDSTDFIQKNSNNLQKKKNRNIWSTIAHFLRYFVYRFWGLLFFIMFILLISILFRNCSAASCNNCNNIDSLNIKILELQKKVEERCKN